MFLSNSYSFSLVRPEISKPVIRPVRSNLAEVSLETRAFGASETSNGIQSGRKTFLPPHQNASGVNPLMNDKTTRGVIHPNATSVSPWCGGLPNAHSFSLVRSVTLKPVIQAGIQESAIIGDTDKRTFLKVAGVAGAGLAASLLLPKKADAFIMGSSPTTGVVGVKNVANTRINPATEGTLDEVLKTTDLNITSGDLQVMVTSLPPSSFSDSGGVDKKGLVNAARNVQVDVLSSALPTTASTETTLQTISFGGKKYALKMTTVGSVDYIAEADTGTAFSTPEWRAKKVDSTTGIVITWADGDEEFNNLATNLPGLTYL